MRRALIPAFLLLVGSAVLGATVFREPLAQAASNMPSVFVSNDHAHAVPVAEQNLDNGNIKVHEEGTANVNVTNTTVPVHEQGTVRFGGTTEVALPPTVLQGQATTVDVSPYKEIRVGVQAFGCPSTVTLATSESGTSIRLDTLTLDCLNGTTDATRTYEIPGTTLQISVDNSAKVVVWGRAN